MNEQTTREKFITNNDLVQVNLLMPREMHLLLKATAKTKGISMQKIINYILKNTDFSKIEFKF